MTNMKMNTPAVLRQRAASAVLRRLPGFQREIGPSHTNCLQKKLFENQGNECLMCAWPRNRDAMLFLTLTSC
jgi:hypothetical protein